MRTEISAIQFKINHTLYSLGTRYFKGFCLIIYFPLISPPFHYQ